jgi:UDP-N-acetylmuramate dehydrogenase
MPHYHIDDAHEKIPAGWMIEQCGWKGRTVGRAGVHGKQALVLVNRGGATGQEVVDLCHAIQKDVQDRFGIRILPEVNII